MNLTTVSIIARNSRKCKVFARVYSRKQTDSKDQPAVRFCKLSAEKRSEPFEKRQTLRFYPKQIVPCEVVSGDCPLGVIDENVLRIIHAECAVRIDIRSTKLSVGQSDRIARELFCISDQRDLRIGNGDGVVEVHIAAQNGRLGLGG